MIACHCCITRCGRNCANEAFRLQFQDREDVQDSFIIASKLQRKMCHWIISQSSKMTALWMEREITALLGKLMLFRNSDVVMG